MAFLTAHDKLSALRAELKKLGVDGFIVPHSDEFQSEYLQPSAERLAWLTGFTGSSGAAAILPDQAAAFTDGRYLIQIRQQVDEDQFEVVDITKAGVGEWLSHRATNGQVIGYDARLHTPAQINAIADKLKDKGLVLRAISANPIDTVWKDRGTEVLALAEVFPESIAGVSSATKRTEIAAGLKEKGIASVVITLPESIAWLLNIRGADVPHNPLVLSYAILHADDARVDWFVDERKIPADVKAHLGNTVSLHKLADIGPALAKLSGSVQIDYQRSPQWFVDQLQAAGLTIRDGKDPCILPKALKTPEEQAAMRTAHLRDGVAITKFLHWFDQLSGEGTLTELDVEAKLLEFRQAQSGFRTTSFDTIAGWAGHGAIVHYRATEKTSSTISGDGVLLLDSGAQYADGTTDITRTIAVGDPTPEMKDRYTRVLKGHIALACAIFPAETTGGQLDTLARKSLWEAGLDYAHGTGHGVGCYLCVHEEAARFSPRSQDPVRPGMIISNEPGYYKEGEFGIRIENLILCIETGMFCSDGREMLAFDTITLAPYDKRLIKTDLLTEDEREWLDSYHERVYQSLADFLEPDEREWLKAATLQA